MRFKVHPANLSVIPIYAPNFSSDKIVMDEFYDSLQSLVNEVPEPDLLAISGDWNARPGPQEEATRRIVRWFGLGQRYENGDRVLSSRL
ncbi:unnamed protein product [Echinostoma caproni]|uniref:Endo/exonuclease/phosphatase domain-containing protein n=1 Tax=Echinostoma caproni TaxID=27848 RepID=A0A183AFG2_9TREM|nr:unnamed protein product [Echinostoma caproni]